jgi:hypothetical protein
MTIGYGPSIVTSGLVLALDAADRNSYPGSGTAWTDLSGRGNTGTLVNGPTYSSVNGGSIVFDGTNDYVTLPGNSINTNADFTLNFWNKTASTVSSIRTLLGVSSGQGHLQVRYNSTSIQLVYSNLSNMGSFTGFTASSSTVYLITITLNKSTNTYSLYVNGNFVSTIVSAQNFATSAPALGTNLTIEVFNSNIYAFSYYNRALTAAEIQQNFNALRRRYGI